MALHSVFLALGGILLIGLLTDEIGRRTQLPRVTLLILFGVALGPFGLDLLPAQFHEWSGFLTAAALTMVAFLLGGQLSQTEMVSHGKVILLASLAAIAVTAVVVGVGLLALGTSVIVALVLAGISTATDPAATQDVVRQSEAKGTFTTVLLGIVAVDDALGIVAFSFILVLADSIAGDGAANVLLNGAWEIGGAILVGAAVGFPASYLTGRLQAGEPIQLEALGVVFLCAGLAIWLDVSYLLAGIVAGMIVVNFARHHSRAFHEIEHIEWPFMVFFFVLAGASLVLDSLAHIGLIGAAYILLRTIGRILGGWLGSRAAGADRTHSLWLGSALMPQAGVALGMALVASDQFPEHRETILALTIGSTVIFELVGPVFTLLALRKVGEAGKRR